jgi:hypothetical protein
MKYLIIILLAFFVYPCFGQNSENNNAIGIDIITKKYSTSGVVHVDSMSARQLLEAAYKWLSEIKYVNTLGSKGIIADEAAFNRLKVSQYFFGTYKTKIRFIASLEFRDGRYKYTFTDFSYIETTARTDFEEAINKEDKTKVIKYLKDGNEYIAEWVNELTAYLNAYKPDESW